MMLDWLGHAETRRGGAIIYKAVESVLSNPENRTPDLGGKLSTTQMGSLITEQILAQ